MKAEESILIERLKKGERTAFNELYGIFWAPLVNYAELIVGDENADDVVQEVFVRIWIGRDKLRNDGSLSIACGLPHRAQRTTVEKLCLVLPVADKTANRTAALHLLRPRRKRNYQESLRTADRRRTRRSRRNALAEMPRSIPYEPFRGAVEQRDLGAAEYQRFDRRESYQQCVAAITRQTGPSENVFAVDDLHLGTIKAVDE